MQAHTEYQNPFTTSSTHPTHASRAVAGWSSPVARQAHNLKVTGSNPVPATKFQTRHHAALTGGVVVCGLSEHIRDHCDDVVFGISITVWIDRQAVDEYRHDLRSFAAAGFRDAVSRERPSFSSNSGSARCGRMMGVGITLISVLGEPSAWRFAARLPILQPARPKRSRQQYCQHVVPVRRAKSRPT